MASKNLTRCGGTMTESQYLAWIRSALRSKSLRWPPRAEALRLARRPYNGPNKMQKWEFKCDICRQWHKAKDVIVDHWPISAGSILHTDDIGPFANNLYCEVDNLRVLDRACHDVHTLASEQGISFEEAAIQKRVIAVMKNSKDFVVDLCKKNGYRTHQLTNSEKRKAALTEIFTKELQ